MLYVKMIVCVRASLHQTDLTHRNLQLVDDALSTVLSCDTFSFAFMGMDVTKISTEKKLRLIKTMWHALKFVRLRS